MMQECPYPTIWFGRCFVRAALFLISFQSIPVCCLLGLLVAAKGTSNIDMEAKCLANRYRVCRKNVSLLVVGLVEERGH